MICALGALFWLPLLADDVTPLEKQVRETEQAFAQTMADRDFAAFQAFLSAETIFFAGENPMRGAATVAEAWKGYFDGDQAPFSWQPRTVVVLASGDLAQSSGPVFDPAGNQVGNFHSIWRLEDDGEWRIVFDKGYPHCPPPQQPPGD